MKRSIFLMLFILMIGGFMESSMAKNHSDQKATFAGGCFWCMEKPFEHLNGVKQVISGYAGGTRPNPTYEYVSSGQSDYAESVQITFDPTIISYNTLLKVYWQQINPTDAGGQFGDRGAQYRPIIFYHDARQQALAEKSKSQIEKSGIFQAPIVVFIKPFTTFYPAEEYHQDYYSKHSVKYRYFRYASGRTPFLNKVWTDENKSKLNQAFSNTAGAMAIPSRAELRKILTPLQYRVTQENGTEEAFHNTYWDNKKAGIYVDIVSGEPLFSSLDKFDSGTGWPSFTKPLEPNNIVEKEDRSLFRTRIEVRSKQGNSHLGHVFNDGPLPTGLRYCMNSAALRFIPKEDLQKAGYGQYLKLFAATPATK